MLFWTLIISFLFSSKYRFVVINGIQEKRTKLYQAIIVFMPIIFFIGLRGKLADTESYIISFKFSPETLNSITWNSIDKDKGFYLLQVMFKQAISSDYRVWLFFIALISGICVMITLYKHSPMFGLSAFIFIASSEFTWLLNGIRQFIVVSILFACVGLITQKKTWSFIIIIFILSSFHGTVIIMIPIYFIVRFKPWGKHILISAMLICLSGIFLERFSSVFSFLLEGTQYNGYIENVVSGNGSNIFRLLIAMVPCSLAFLNRKKIQKNNNPIINISINMSLINACMMFVSTLTSGLLMGRLSIYFSLYNLILLPWLIVNTFKSKDIPFVYYSCLIFYTVYFYYQIVITWNLPYISDILKLKIY